MNFKDFFSYVPQNIEPFTLFGRHHIIQLLSLVFFNHIVYYFSEKE